MDLGIGKYFTCEKLLTLMHDFCDVNCHLIKLCSNLWILDILFFTQFFVTDSLICGGFHCDAGYVGGQSMPEDKGEQWMHKGESCRNWRENGCRNLSLPLGIAPRLCTQNSLATSYHTSHFSFGLHSSVSSPIPLPHCLGLFYQMLRLGAELYRG